MRRVAGGGYKEVPQHFRRPDRSLNSASAIIDVLTYIADAVYNNAPQTRAPQPSSEGLRFDNRLRQTRQQQKPTLAPPRVQAPVAWGEVVFASDPTPSYRTYDKALDFPVEGLLRRMGVERPNQEQQPAAIAEEVADATAEEHEWPTTESGILPATVDAPTLIIPFNPEQQLSGNSEGAAGMPPDRVLSRYGVMDFSASNGGRSLFEPHNPA